MCPLPIALVFAVVSMGSAALADTSSSSDTKNPKTYGNCHVQTKVDMLTDEVSHHFLCYEDSFTDRTLIGVQNMKLPYAGNLIITLSKGVQAHFSKRIPSLSASTKKAHRPQAVWGGTQNAFIDDAIFAPDSSTARQG